MITGSLLSASLVACAPVKTDEPKSHDRTATERSKPRTPPANQPAPPMPSDPDASFVLASTGLPTTGMWKCDPLLVDANGDGHMDLAAIARLGDGPHVFFGDGKGGWTDSSSGMQTSTRSCGGGVAVIDVNHDGLLDLAAGDHCNGIFVYLGDGKGGWKEVTAGLHPSDRVEDETNKLMLLGAEDIDAGDVNGDGHVDLLSAGSDEGGLSIYLGDGTGMNWTRVQGDLVDRGWANRVRLVDVSGDGYLDIVATHSDGPTVYKNDGKGNWFWSGAGLPRPLYQGLYIGLDVADMNGDGRQDLILANWVDGPEIYLQQEDQSWKKTADVFPQMLGGAQGVATGDLDGDGDRDIIATGRLEPKQGLVRGVFVLYNEGEKGWRYDAASGLPTTGLLAMAGATVGDFTGDGLMDVVACTGLIAEMVSSSAANKPTLEPRVAAWKNNRSNAPASAASAGRPGS